MVEIVARRKLLPAGEFLYLFFMKAVLQMKVKAVKADNSHNENGGQKSALNHKISSLKQNVITLIQEVKELGNASHYDLTEGIDLYDEVQRFEINLIRQALEETDGHQVQAARLLGLNVTTLNAKIKRYGIDPKDLPDGDGLPV